MIDHKPITETELKEMERTLAMEPQRARLIGEVRRLHDLIASAKDAQHLAIAGDGRWQARMERMLYFLNQA